MTIASTPFAGVRAAARRRGRPRTPGLVSHTRRPPLAAHHPVHLTLRVRPDVWSLRAGRTFRVIRRAFAGGRDRFGFRLVHYSVQGNHFHFIAEADDARALTRGMKGLAVRLAKRLNRVMGRRGALFEQRYHARQLTTTRAVRNALRYVLNNRRRHMAQVGKALPSKFMDPYSSARVAEIWRLPLREYGPPTPRWCANAHALVMPPRTDLLARLWTRLGRLDPADVPGR